MLKYHLCPCYLADGKFPSDIDEEKLITTMQQVTEPSFDMSGLPALDTFNPAMFDFDLDDSYAWWADNGVLT